MKQSNCYTYHKVGIESSHTYLERALEKIDTLIISKFINIFYTVRNLKSLF